jgi:thioredoxin 1
MSLSKVIHLNDQSIEKAILGNKKIVIDFWADWCGPCKIMSPIIDELSLKAPEDVLIAKANIEDCPLSAKGFEITSIPALLFFNEAQETKRVYGLTTSSNLLEEVNSL